MRRINRTINSNVLSLLEITVYDEEDVEELKHHHSEKNFALGMDMLPYLDFFSQAEYIVLTGGELGESGFEPLYRINPKALVVDYENTDDFDEKIDLSRFTGLEYLFSRAHLNCDNYAGCGSLRTLVVFQWKDMDLRELSNAEIDSLEIIRGELTSLDYIDRLPKLKVLYLSYLRDLMDLSAIKQNCSVNKIKIENCGKADLRGLFESGSLHYLLVSGNNRISSLNDLRKSPNLEYLILDGCLIEDGDIDSLKNIQHAVIFPHKKQYSQDDVELPKGRMPYFLNEIPKWRQFNP